MTETQKAVVVTVANTKGGVGKTTVSCNLAWALAELGHRVMLVDADVQRSSTKWLDLAEEVPFDRCQLVTARSLQTELVRLRRTHDVIVIDCPPLQSDVTAAAVSQATLALIPVIPSPLDVLAYPDLIPLLRQASAMSPSLSLRFVVNYLDERAALGEEVIESLAESELGDISGVHLHYLQEYRKIIKTGRSVVTQPGKAQREIRALAAETASFLGLRVHNLEGVEALEAAHV